MTSQKSHNERDDEKEIGKFVPPFGDRIVNQEPPIIAYYQPPPQANQPFIPLVNQSDYHTHAVGPAYTYVTQPYYIHPSTAITNIVWYTGYTSNNTTG